MLTNKQFVEFLKKASSLNLPYWYGCYGQTGTEALYQSKKKQYPQYYNRSSYKQGWSHQYGKHVADCIGGLKYFLWTNGNIDGTPKYNANQDVNVGGLYNLSKEKGTIKTMPEIPGLAVIMPHHIGYYIGNGLVVEWRGHDYGCVTTKLKSRPWENWAKIPWISYTNTGTVTTTPAPTTTTKPTSTTTNKTANYKITKDVNVRKGPGVTYSKVKYDGFPAEIQNKMKKKYNYLPAGLQVRVISRTSNNWLKLGEGLYIAGNYAIKL